MRYLIYSRNGIGDFMWMLPYAEAIRKADPDADIVSYSGGAQDGMYERMLEMMKIQTGVNGRICYHIHRPLSLLKCIWRLGFKKFDYSFIVGDINVTRKGLGLYMGIWAAKTSVGNIADAPYTIALKKDPSILSRRYYYGQMLKAVGINPPKEGEPCIPKERLLPYLESSGFAHIKGKHYIGIAVGCLTGPFRKGFKYYYNDVKSWMPERWEELMKRLRDGGYSLILLGGKTEREKIEESGIHIPEGVIDAINKTSILESIAIVSACDLLVSGDTGMMHVAYNVGTPTLTLFGPTDPQKIAIYSEKNQVITTQEPCAPCWGEERMIYCTDKTCMKKITVQMVYDKITEMMDKQN